MDKKTCYNCGGSGNFEPELAFARLAKRNDAIADVLASFLEVTAPGEQRSLTVTDKGLVEALLRDYKRILGGKPTADYPECCLVGRRVTNGTIGWFCSGVLVHPQIVLTAGHCVVADNRPNIVALGAADQNHLSEAELISIRRLEVNPRYSPTSFISDITVFILREPAKTPPVQIATVEEFSASNEVTLVGFGNDDPNIPKGFGIKREVDVKVISMRRAPEDKLDADEELLGFESDLEFVAGGGGFDSCNGDSGGPAYITTGSKRKLVGLTSRMTENSANACGDGGVYTRVDAHIDFITGVAINAGITDFG